MNVKSLVIEIIGCANKSPVWITPLNEKNIKVYWYTSFFCCHVFKREIIFMTLFANLEDSLSKCSTLKGKNLLGWERILSFMR